MSDFKLDHLISKRAAGRVITHFVNNEAPTGVKPHPKPLSLGGGTPNYGFFPIESILINLIDAPFAKEQDPLTPADSTEDLKIKSRTAITPSVTEDKEVIDLKAGLQYALIEGLDPLVKFITDFVARVQKPVTPDWQVVLSNGAGNGLNKVVDLFIDPEDVVLVEEFTFSPFLSSVKNCGGYSLPVKLDFFGEGIDYEYLKNLLENWDTIYPGKRMPKLLYTIPTGQNPTGLVQSLELRKKIYALAEKYDFAILEDDPYGYLALPSYNDIKSGKVDVNKEISVSEFIDDVLYPSYLSIDTSGRVVRVETFSKVFAPGLRLGYIVGSKNFIKAINSYANISTRSPSGPSQILVNNVINHWGGLDGWLGWIMKVRKEYILRRNTMLDTLYASELFKKNLISVIDPKAGMFVSVVLNYDTDKYTPEQYASLTKKELVYKAVETGVEIVPGPNMAFDPLANEHSNFVRLTIASASCHEQLIEATNRFCAAVELLFAEI